MDTNTRSEASYGGHEAARLGFPLAPSLPCGVVVRGVSSPHETGSRPLPERTSTAISCASRKPCTRPQGQAYRDNSRASQPRQAHGSSHRIRLPHRYEPPSPSSRAKVTMMQPTKDGLRADLTNGLDLSWHR